MEINLDIPKSNNSETDRQEKAQIREEIDSGLRKTFQRRPRKKKKCVVFLFLIPCSTRGQSGVNDYACATRSILSYFPYMNLGWASLDLGQPGQPYEGGRGIGRGEGWCWYSPIKKKVGNTRCTITCSHTGTKIRPDKATGMYGTRSRSTGTAPGRGRGRGGVGNPL